MPCYYLQPEQDDYDQIPELQVCLAEASLLEWAPSAGALFQFQKPEGIAIPPLHSSPL